jgi:hypothetical protein
MLISVANFTSKSSPAKKSLPGFPGRLAKGLL